MGLSGPTGARIIAALSDHCSRLAPVVDRRVGLPCDPHRALTRPPERGRSSPSDRTSSPKPRTHGDTLTACLLTAGVNAAVADALLVRDVAVQGGDLGGTAVPSRIGEQIHKLDPYRGGRAGSRRNPTPRRGLGRRAPRGARPGTVIDLGLGHPPAQRLGGGDSMRAVRAVRRIDPGLSVLDLFSFRPCGAWPRTSAAQRARQHCCTSSRRRRVARADVTVVALPFGGGRAISYTELARQLPDTWAVQAIQPPGTTTHVPTSRCSAFPSSQRSAPRRFGPTSLGRSCCTAIAPAARSRSRSRSGLSATVTR